MAANLSNLIVPQVFGGYVAAERDKMNAFVKSGAAVVSPQMNALLAGGANKFTLPFWKNISATGIVPSTDYEAMATVQKMSAGSQNAVRLFRAIEPVAVTALEGMLVGSDPVQEAVRQLAEAHNQIRQTSLIAMINAVTAVDSADAGVAADLTYTSAATSLSGDVLATAVATVWGDAVRGLAGLTLVMNSLEFLDLQKLVNAASGIAFPNAIDVGFGTFMGATVVVDDTVANDTVYVIKRGGLAFGTASLAVPFEMERKPGAGNGGGAELIYSRDLFGYHVAGTSYTGAIAGDVATDAEVGLLGNWSLVKSAKLCGVMKITHAA